MEQKTNFHAVILRRFLTREELEDLTKRYNAARHTDSQKAYEPKPLHIECFNKWAEGYMTEKEAAKLMSCHPVTAITRFARIGLLKIQGKI